MFSGSTISLPAVTESGSLPLVHRNTRIKLEQLPDHISSAIEALGANQLNDVQQSLLRSIVYVHYHPELSIRSRVKIYQSVKATLEDDNLNQLRDIAGIRQKSAYINTISNVGKRSSYFGGLIGITVAGHFFLPPFVKFGVLPMARRTFRRLVPKQTHLIPFDKALAISSLVHKSGPAVYAGIRKSLSHQVRSAGRVVKSINPTAMDDLVGNLFFRALIEKSGFEAPATEDLRKRAHIAFLHDMCRVGRQLEGLACNPDQCWQRVSHYTNFAMFLKSMESKEVPIQAMLYDSVEIISRAKIGRRKHDKKFYLEFERVLKHLCYLMEEVAPLDKLNRNDPFDDIETTSAQLAFLEQNRKVMESLYRGHDRQLQDVLPMFTDFIRAATELEKKNLADADARYRWLQSRIRTITGKFRKPLRELALSEIRNYRAELSRL